MELPRTSPARTQSYRTSQDAHYPRDPERYLLRRSWWLCLEAPTARLPTMEDRLPLLQSLAPERCLGRDALCPTQTSASSPQEEPSTQRSHSRFPVGQNDRRRWRRTRLRRRKEGQRTQAPSTG